MTLKLELSKEEEKIFLRLLDVVRHYRLGTTLRVAGGWVRDKLLGKQPTDIDIALDNITGQDFSQKVDAYLKLIGEGDKKRGTKLIPCNPDKSKHLETAKTYMFNKEIDFVNLRSEKYAESSRIPTMKDATPEEDAHRRDLTINSLFFNINDHIVEDFTKRGIDDVIKGLIDTPLDAKATFLDDPLRVLRAIRFAARFNFTLSDRLKEAASDEKVKLELACKISKERVGKEIDLMMSGEHPADAMSYIRDLGLFYIAFAFPKNCSPPVFDNCDRCCVSHIESAWNFAISVHSGVSHPMLLDEEEKLYLYSALFFPLRRMFYLNKNSKKIAVTSYIIQESLKLPACVAKSVLDVHAASRKFADLVLLFESNVASRVVRDEVEDACHDIPMDTWKRVYAGVVLNEIKDLWRVALAISIIFYPEAENAGGTLIQQQDELHRRKEQYMRVERSITDLGLNEVWKLEPLVNGKIIMQIMQKSESPLIGEWKKRLFKWQLAHPEGSRDDCVDWLNGSQSKRQKVESST
ncbi:CCA tRNA nucleotidyltransferase, mitochondrial-like [Triticum dicoccoides]|uniref:CCA tRNA nucleotidyltransferase, mitochondrial-like n=1 Tax=Triticum dicoccoides TaxID=85692 RepID=UPI00188F10A3|nr:CCA tRNA nucleotidyltransferase, mitochondrial-like [Triticum dicoccoides]